MKKISKDEISKNHPEVTRITDMVDRVFKILLDEDVEAFGVFSLKLEDESAPNCFITGSTFENSAMDFLFNIMEQNNPDESKIKILPKTDKWEEKKNIGYCAIEILMEEFDGVENEALIILMAEKASPPGLFFKGKESGYIERLANALNESMNSGKLKRIFKINLN